MSRIEFVHWVEIPIRVFGEYQPREESTMTYPGCPETVGIDDIEIAEDELHNLSIPVNRKFTIKDLLDHIMLEYGDKLEEEAWEHRE